LASVPFDLLKQIHGIHIGDVHRDQVPILISHCTHLELLDEIFQDGYEPLFPQGKLRVSVVRLVWSIGQIVAFSIPAKLGIALPRMGELR
jgi:hypothetical protein